MHRIHRVSGAALLALLWMATAACSAKSSKGTGGGNSGNEAGESGTGGTNAGTGGAGAGADAGASGAGRGAGGSGGRGAAGGGNGGVGAGAAGGFPCGTAVPVVDATTGLEQCSRGYQRRVGPANCPSSVPRTAPIPAYNAAIDQCEHDADCSTATYGRYAHCGARSGGFARACVEGCKLDADCEPGNVCLCGDPVGRCVRAGCSTGDDCAPGFDCASFAADPGCFSTQFACQSAADSCGADGDCAGISPNAAFCVYASGSRACSITQCTTP